jgi:hypothetical protein
MLFSCLLQFGFIAWIACSAILSFSAKTRKAGLVSLAASLTLTSFVVCWLSYSSFEQVDTESSWDDIVGTWQSMPNSFQDEVSTIKIEEDRITLENFPSLVDFRSPQENKNPKVRKFSGQTGARIQAMPRGWGIVIHNNWLRIVSRRGKLYFQQHGSVYSSASIEYQRIE